jgi:hypothetical protein
MGLQDVWNKAADAWHWFYDDAINTFQKSFGTDMPKAFHDFWSGAASMTNLYHEEETFGEGARNFLDGLTGMGSALLGGTLGTAFNLGGLRSAAHGIDTVYRHGVTRPLATMGLYGMSASLESNAAGEGFSGYIKRLTPSWARVKKTFNETEGVTPGQVLMWGIGGNVGAIGDGDYEWARRHDPRTPEGQATYNGEDSEGLLKYGSGTTDLALALVGDPAQALSIVAKGAKARYIDHVNTPKAIRAGRVHAEIDSKSYGRVLQQAKLSPNWEHFRDRVMPDATFGGAASALLWHAAKISDDLFRDVYLVARTGDREAWARVEKHDKAIATKFRHTFANWNMGANVKMVGDKPGALNGAADLAMKDIDAFLGAKAAGEGIWGQLESGTMLARTKQPKVRALSTFRAGVHTAALYGVPVYIGRPTNLRLPIKTFLPSQGYTPWIDILGHSSAERPLKQFRANLERYGMAEDRVNRWTSAFSLMTSSERRGAIALAAEKEGIELIAKKYNLDAKSVKAAMQKHDQMNFGIRSLFKTNKLYLTEHVAEKAAENVEAGRKYDPRTMDHLSAQIAAGKIANGHVIVPDPHGSANAVPLPGSYKAPNPHEPMLESQHAPLAHMIDGRALEGAIKAYAALKAARGRGIGHYSLAKTADLARSGKALAVNGAEFANMIWKSSALMRPAQLPRNIADEFLRSAAQFGNAYLIMHATSGMGRAVYNNAFLRPALIKEGVSNWVRSFGNSQRSRASTPAVIAPDTTRQIKVPIRPNGKYSTIDEAFADGRLEAKELVDHLEARVKNGTATNPELILHSFHSGRPQSNRRASDVRDGKLTQYEFDVAKYALDKHNMLAYERDSVMNSLLGAMSNRHMTKKTFDPANPDAFYEPGTIVFDPLRGREYIENGPLHEHYDVLHHKIIKLHPNPAGVPKNSATYLANGADLLRDIGFAQPRQGVRSFIDANLDDLVRQDRLMSMYITKEGNIAVMVLKGKHAGMETEGTYTGTPWQRLKNLSREGDPTKKRLSSAGYQRQEYTTFDGQTKIDLGAAFDGTEGQGFLARASSRGVGGAWMSLIGNMGTAKRLLEESGTAQFREYTANDPHYHVMWERAVNAQIASDPIARMFLKGKTDSHVISWLEHTRAGTRYWHKMHYRGTHYVEHIREIKALVDEYVPFNDAVPEASLALRDAVLTKRASKSMLDKVLDESDQPNVHGASIDMTLNKGVVFKFMVNAIDNIQKTLNDMPADKASRFPFFAEAWGRHMQDMMSNAEYQFAMVGEAVPAELIGKFKTVARERALNDVRYTLYDTAQINDIARLTRLVMPFSAAMMDSTIKWGRMIRQNPARLVQASYYWNMFERNEAVQDENGYVLRIVDGKEKWYHKDPVTHKLDHEITDPEMIGKDRYVQFAMPSGIANIAGVKRVFGVDAQPVVQVNKKTFNVFAPMPSTGPLVAIPMNEFSLKHVELADATIVKELVLPFGPSANIAKTFVPSNIRSAWEAFAADDGDMAQGQAAAIFQAETIAKELGMRAEYPTMEEVRSRAAQQKYLRFMATWVSPVSYQAVNPYQIYIDTYRQMRKANPKTADQEFDRQYGAEFYAVRMSVTSNLGGIPATVQGHNNLLKNIDLVRQYPELAGIITGQDGGSFSKAAYEAQKEIEVRPGSDRHMREELPLDETVKQLEVRRVWEEYTQMYDILTAEMAERGIYSLQASGAEDLAEVKDAFVKKYQTWTDPATGQKAISPWFEDYKSFNGAVADKRLMGIRAIVSDEKLMGRTDIQGLADYLSLRDQMQEEMFNLGIRSLKNQNATGLKDQWDIAVHNLTERNVGFGRIWSRFLSQDDALELG